MQGYTNKEEKRYNIFHSYSTTCHVLKALLKDISNFPFFEDIPITKKTYLKLYQNFLCSRIYQ